MLHLAGVSKHAGLRVAGYARWSASACVNQTNGSVDSRKVEISSFDHPWSELDDLFGWERFCVTSLRTTASLNPSADAACCMVSQRRCSGAG